MEQEGTRAHSRHQAPGVKWQGFAVLAALTMMLSACTPAQRIVGDADAAQGFDRITGHGGGVAIMNSGEYVVIRPNGSLSARCYMCTGARENEAACQRTAERRGIPMCHPPVAPATVQPTMLNAPSLPGPGAATPRSGVMCPVFGPTGQLPSVLYNPGWPYWCNYSGGAAPSCTCYKMQ